MCLNESDNKVLIGNKNLSGEFPIQNFSLTRDGLELNGKHQLLIYADD
jgi:hypothetical protein